MNLIARISTAFNICIISLTAFAQESAFYAGSVLSLVSEKRSAKIYGQGDAEKTSKTINVGFGIKTSYVRNNLKFGMGLSLIKRNYKMVRPFDHCFFNGPGEPCDFILAHVDRYSYKTIEAPLSIDLRLFNRKKFSYFIGGSYTNAFLLQAEYHAYYPALGTKRESRNLEKFSDSLYGQISITYKTQKKLCLNLQPFVRIKCNQQRDGILLEPRSNMKTSFDSFGLLFEAVYKLSRK